MIKAESPPPTDVTKMLPERKQSSAMPLLDGRALRLCLCMVGLPARGKSFTARKVASFASWLGHQARIFNVGNYRRRKYGASHRHDYFDQHNPEGVQQRNSVADDCLSDLLDWLSHGKTEGRVAVFDATNTTMARRDNIRRRFQQRLPSARLIFVEIICNDPSLVRRNVEDQKIFSPDYRETDPSEAAQDFLKRLAHYEEVYETVDVDGHEDLSSYLKLVNVQQKVIMNRINGYLAGRLCFFLGNLNLTKHPIWLSRHGESQANTLGKVGMDTDLSESGELYASKLGPFMRSLHNEYASLGRLQVWTSTLQRSVQTGSAVSGDFAMEHVEWKALDEIDAGVFDGWSYDRIRREHPEEFEARRKDKLNYRYPRGESYVDVIRRLEPVIIEIERQTAPVLVVAHQAVVRCLYGYFMNIPLQQVPLVDVPLHTVIELMPKTFAEATKFECYEKRHVLMPDLSGSHSPDQRTPQTRIISSS